MLTKYVVSYETDYNTTVYYQVFECHVNATWRELQQKFDPKYRFNFLKFYCLGSEIQLTK
jgi:hypothetical protein